MSATDRMWPVLNQLMKGHTVAYRVTGGLVGHRFPGAPPSLLSTRGGKERHQADEPAHLPAGRRQPRPCGLEGRPPPEPGLVPQPARAPDTTVQVGSKRREVHARVAGPEERARLWPKVVENYSGYAGYQERTEREIPLVILEPRGG